jgi:hypothetical protein
MKKIILSVWLSLLITSVIIVPQVLAQTEGCPAGSTTCLNNPLGSINSPQALIGKIITSVLGIVGSLALLMFVYGGLIWMTSSGTQEKVKQGRDTLMWAAIGLVVIFSAYALTRVLLNSVVG